MSEVTTPTSQAVADAVRELGIAAPSVQDPIAKYDASQAPVDGGQGEPATAADALKAEAEAKPEATAAPKTETKVESKPDVPETIEEALSLTAEDFAEIEKNPAAKKAYKMMLRDYRKKTGDLAGSRKAFEAEAALMEQIKTNPRAALQALATVSGIPITIGGDRPAGQPAVAEDDPVKKAIASASKQLDDVLTPEGAKVLRPVLENLARAIAEETVAPLKRKAAEDQKVTAQATVNSTIKSFGSERMKEGEEWSPEIEKEMAGLVGKIMPGPQMDVNGYIDLLYSNVMAGRIRASNRKREFDRLKAAQGASEPVNGSRPAAKGEQSITAGMSIVDATRLAVAQSLSELRGGR